MESNHDTSRSLVRGSGSAPGSAAGAAVCRALAASSPRAVAAVSSKKAKPPSMLPTTSGPCTSAARLCELGAAGEPREAALAAEDAHHVEQRRTLSSAGQRHARRLCQILHGRAAALEQHPGGG